VKVKLRYAIYFGMFWALITYMPTLFINSFYCAPHVGDAWNFAVGTRCADPLKWEVAAAVMSVMLDIFILVLPIPAIIELNLAHQRRLGVLLVFLTAAFAIVCAILTLVYRINILQSSGDASWHTAQLFICNGAENYTAIIVGCAPGLSSFFKTYVAESQFFQSLAISLLSRRDRSHASSNGSGNTKTSRGERHIGLATFGGTPYKSKQGELSESTSNLQGYTEIKDGKIITKVSHGSPPSLQEDTNLGDDGIQKSIGFEQRSAHSSGA